MVLLWCSFRIVGNSLRRIRGRFLESFMRRGLFMPP